MKQKYAIIFMIILVFIFSGCNFNIKEENNLLDVRFIPLEAGNDASQEQVVESKAPAPPLTSLDVWAVISSNYPSYDYVYNSFLTQYDHGGALMYIVTREIGYGGSPYAAINGTRLTEVQSQRILSGSNIIGWYRWWDASGFQNGQFTYRNKSMNSPWNTMSDWVNIR